MKTEIIIVGTNELRVGDKIVKVLSTILKSYKQIYKFIVEREIKPVVDGLTACKAYLEGKRITRKEEGYYHLDKALSPDFRLNDWEIVE